MDPQQDFRELLQSFNACAVEYVVVGGYALAFHGAPRMTGDLDLWVRPTSDNADRVLDALARFGMGSLGLTRADLDEPNQVVQIGYPPARVDIITSIDGVAWDQAWAGKTAGAYADVPVHFIGRQDLIANKRAAGRRQDLADLEALGESD